MAMGVCPPNCCDCREVSLLDGEQNQAVGECSVGGMSALRSPLTMTLVCLPGRSGTRKHLEWKPRSTSLVDLGSKFQWKPRSTHPAHFNQLGAQVNPSRIPGLCSLGSSHPEWGWAILSIWQMLLNKRTNQCINEIFFSKTEINPFTSQTNLNSN